MLGRGEFAVAYRDLLRDTGLMTPEELARKHLGIELTEADFWRGAIDLLAADVEQFLQLTSEENSQPARLVGYFVCGYWMVMVVLACCGLLLDVMLPTMV